MSSPVLKGAALGFLLATGIHAWAAPPQISGTTPYGLPRGSEGELVISGANLGGTPELIAPFPFARSSPTAPNTDGGNWKLKITVPAETPLGAYPIRVKTENGISNPLLFTVGQLPQVAEKEENNTFETAQAIPSPVVVEGQAAGNDVDFFRFPGKKGQVVLIDAQCARIGSGVDPSIRLTSAGRTFVGSADDSSGLLTDARLVATLPEDGDFVVEISDSRYQGGGRPIYRLVIGPVPMAEEIYPLGGRNGETVGFELRGGTLPSPGVAAALLRGVPEYEVAPVRITEQMLGIASSKPPLDLESLAPRAVGAFPELRESEATGAPVKGVAPVVFNGRIDPAKDEDRFALAVTPGQRLHIEVDAAELGSALDGVLQVLGANNAVLATNDDTTLPQTGRKGKGAGLVSPDPSLDFTVGAGVSEIVLALKDLEGRGGVGYSYRITVTPIAPGFELALNDPQVSIPKGGSAAVGVSVVRKGYNGPITLKVLDPPAGLAFRPGTIAAGQAIGSFTVSAAPEANLGAVTLAVAGEGKGDGGPVLSRAEKSIVFAQQGNFPTSTLTQIGLVAATAPAAPVRLDAPETVDVVHGLGGPVPVKVERPGGANGALTVSPVVLPPGIAVPNVNVGEKATDATVNVNVAPEALVGASTITLVAKGRVANADQTLALPAVTLNVVRPVELTLAAPNLELKPGATAELKGKVTRRGAFKEPVTVKLNGLPAGLKAEPVVVAPDASEFVAKLVADATAPAASASAAVALAFQVNKKDYPLPPVALPLKVLAK